MGENAMAPWLQGNGSGPFCGKGESPSEVPLCRVEQAISTQFVFHYTLHTILILDTRAWQGTPKAKHPAQKKGKEGLEVPICAGFSEQGAAWAKQEKEKQALRL